MDCLETLKNYRNVLSPCRHNLLGNPCDRALSDFQENAQLLTGEAMPNSVMEALLAESPNAGNQVGILNLSPYEGSLELMCLKYHLRTDYKLKSLSLSTDILLTGHTEKQVAFTLLEARLL